jgi:hypothetical protein
MHNGMYDFKKKNFFFENLLCVVQLRVKGDQHWRAGSTGKLTE